MAGNIPQMAVNSQMMMLQQAQQQQAQQQHHQQQQQQHQQQPQTQNKQFQNLIYSNLMQSMSTAPGNSWQSQLNIGDRFAKTSNLYGSSPPHPISSPIPFLLLLLLCVLNSACGTHDEAPETANSS
jgi:hypothetical protein